MKKNPYFPFYCSDFLSGTQIMTAKEVGVYIRLLAWSWEHGPLTDSMARLARMAGASRTVVQAVLDLKWEQTAEGWVQPRLEAVRLEVDQHREKQRKNGKKGGRPRKKKADKAAETTSGAVPTENPVVNSGLTQTETQTKAKKSSSKPKPKPKPNITTTTTTTTTEAPAPAAPAQASEPPSAEVVVAYAVDAGIRADLGKEFHAKYSADGWLDQHGQAIRNWQRLLTAWAAHQPAAPPKRESRMARLRKQAEENRKWAAESTKRQGSPQ